MNYKMIGAIMGHILLLEGLFMLPAMAVSVGYQENSVAMAYLITIVLTGICAFILHHLKPSSKEFYAKEGFITVSIGWILISFFGALPFFISGEIPNFVDCMFETISGFTTTGASILTDVETLSKGLLYWRSFTHWLGGMGVLVFLLAVVPMGGKGQGNFLHLMRAESPGPVVGKLVPKMRQTAKILYVIYIVITIVELVLLLLGGMPLFDSVTTAFGTAGTGGFAIKNSSIAYYDSAYLDAVITIFMALFGINFNAFYLILIGEFSSALRNDEVRAYLGIMIASIVIIAVNILPIYKTPLQALRYSSFQVSSIMTTTGFATADFNQWPLLSRSILVLLMMLGACAGSTGGGMKISRVILLMKQAVRGARQMAYPGSVQVVKSNGKVIDEKVLSTVNVFLIVYLVILIISVLLISVDNLNYESNFSAVMACFNNIGPGLGIVGPTGNYSVFSNFSKIILSCDMLLGRLEIFPVLILFMPSVWKKR